MSGPLFDSIFSLGHPQVFIVNLEYNAFRVEGDLYEDDVPPGRIKELRATPKTNLSADDRPILTFQCTCGGKHGYDGTAAAFELRGAINTNDLLTGFDNAPLVDAKSDVVKGSLTPRPAFTIQEAEVAVPDALLKEAVIAGKDVTELHSSIRRKSSKNIYSMLSNIATVTVQMPPDTKLPTSTNPPLTSSTSKKTETKLTLKKTPPPPPATPTRRGTISTQEKEDSDDQNGKGGGGKGSGDTEED
ncbi:uncharacterized protein LOC144153534 [Haemaphysalis longicornis]